MMAIVQNGTQLPHCKRQHRRVKLKTKKPPQSHIAALWHASTGAHSERMQMHIHRPLARLLGS